MYGVCCDVEYCDVDGLERREAVLRPLQGGRDQHWVPEVNYVVRHQRHIHTFDAQGKRDRSVACYWG